VACFPAAPRPPAHLLSGSDGGVRSPYRPRLEYERTASGYAGYVLRFEVEASVFDRWPAQQGAAGETFRELWVPAQELDEFNSTIRWPIEFVAEFHGGSPRD
jgi:hypothetical protein